MSGRSPPTFAILVENRSPSQVDLAGRERHHFEVDGSRGDSAGRIRVAELALTSLAPGAFEISARILSPLASIQPSPGPRPLPPPDLPRDTIAPPTPRPAADSTQRPAPEAPAAAIWLLDWRRINPDSLRDALVRDRMLIETLCYYQLLMRDPRRAPSPPPGEGSLFRRIRVLENELTRRGIPLPDCR